MQSPIFVRTIGSVVIEVGDRRIGPSAGRLFALLLYLTSRRGQPTSRRVVQELLFPQSGEGQASHNLRQLIYRLRQARVPIEADADQVAIPDDCVTVDWLRFLGVHPVDDIELERLSHGVFPGYNPQISDAYREWFEEERADITLRLTRALTTQLTQLRRAGRWDLIESGSRALLALDPLSEEGTLAKAEVLALSGSKSAALGVIDGYLQELGEKQPHLQLAPSALKRRISERLPEASHRSYDERLFVGREDSMRMLSALGAATRAGNQQVVLLWGEPGIGKTRLIAEYRALATLQGGITVSLSCQPHDVFRPLGILCDLVTQLLNVPGALGCDPGARRLLERLVSVNRHVDDGREEAAAEAPLSAIVRSLSDLIGAVAAESPLQLFIDDAQWLDPNSERAVLGAFAGRAARRSSLVLTSRDRALLASADSQTEDVSPVRLNPLHHDAAFELARSLLKSSASADVELVARQVIAQGRGNPFVIRMLCSHYASTNDSESLKQTLTEVLGRRLDQLRPDARRTLEAAVILAKNCTFERLERLLAMPRDRLLRAIEVLDDQGLIEVTDGFIVSSHALLADVVVERMATSVQRVMHAAVAELLEDDMQLTALSRLSWAVAEHWRLAGNHSKAIATLSTCAECALNVGRPGDAFATYQMALSLAAEDATRLELLEGAMRSLWQGMLFKEAVSIISELQSVRARLGVLPQPHDAIESLLVAKLLHSDEDPRELIPQLKQCLLASTASPKHKLVAACQLVILAETTLDANLAREAFEWTKHIDEPKRVRMMLDLQYHTTVGSPEQAPRVVVRMQQELGDSLDFTYLLNIGYAYYRLGNTSAALDHLLSIEERFRRDGLQEGEAFAAQFLAFLFWAIREIGQCKRWHDRVEFLLTGHQARGTLYDHCILGARIAIHEGKYELARKFLDRAKATTLCRAEAPRLALLACEADLRICEGSEPCFGSELAELCLLHQKARKFTGQDDNTAALVKVLLHKGYKRDATITLQEYLTTHRRLWFPISPELKRLASFLSEPDFRLARASSLT